VECGEAGEPERRKQLARQGPFRYRPKMSVPHTPDTSLRTYRYLRLGIASTILVITVAVIAASVGTTVKDSISSYYYSSARELVVAALVAVGFGFLAISGRGPQRVLLDLAALFAPLIGLLPACDPEATSCVSDEVVDSVRVAIWTYAAVALLVFTLALVVRKLFSEEPFRFADLVYSFLPAVAVSAILFWAFYGRQELLFPAGHRVATVAFFIILIALAFARGRGKTESSLTTPTRSQRGFYYVAGGLMTVGLGGSIAFTLAGDLGLGFPVVLAFEYLALATFSAFWFVQTFENWNIHDPEVMALTRREE
jgi:hypothetical protein